MGNVNNKALNLLSTCVHILAIEGILRKQKAGAAEGRDGMLRSTVLTCESLLRYYACLCSFVQRPLFIH